MAQSTPLWFSGPLFKAIAHHAMTSVLCNRVNFIDSNFNCMSLLSITRNSKRILHLGLDPAGPLFETRDWAVGLNPSAADLVDVIHTNGKSITETHLGTMKVLGHVDFYPNGGGRQPDCILDPISRARLRSRLRRDPGRMSTELSGEL